MAINRRTRIREGTAQNRFGRVGVLMGGTSCEREISLKSGKAVYQALKQSGLEAVPIDIESDNKAELTNLIKKHNINCAFLALHGPFGEDGQIQRLLEILSIPYTGSGIEASRLAMDKVASRRIFEDAGLAVPRYAVIDKEGFDKELKKYGNLRLPLVTKPAGQGSSIGLSIINKLDDLDKALDFAFTFDKKVIVEEYIKGREMTVGILDDYALPVIEIIPKKKFFDFEAKYQPGMTDYVVPAKIEENVASKIRTAALSAHKLLGCFACSRVDVILNREGLPVILEVNTIPGLTETSLLPKAARAQGLEFNELCLKLLKLAYERQLSYVTQP